MVCASLGMAIVFVVPGTLWLKFVIAYAVSQIILLVRTVFEKTSVCNRILALGARIIQMKYDPPFDPCLMVAFRKRIDLDVSFFLNEEFLKKHNGKNMNIAWLCSQRK